MYGTKQTDTQAKESNANQAGSSSVMDDGGAPRLGAAHAASITEASKLDITIRREPIRNNNVGDSNNHPVPINPNSNFKKRRPNRKKRSASKGKRLVQSGELE